LPQNAVHLELRHIGGQLAYIAGHDSSPINDSTTKLGRLTGGFLQKAESLIHWAETVDRQKKTNNAESMNARNSRRRHVIFQAPRQQSG
jgi:hypothetical protein